MTDLIVYFSTEYKQKKDEDIHLFFLKLLLNDILLESIKLETKFSSFFKFIENMLRIPSNKELLTKEINFGKIFQFLINLFKEETLIETSEDKMNQNLFSLLNILEQLFKAFP